MAEVSAANPPGSVPSGPGPVAAPASQLSTRPESPTHQQSQNPPPAPQQQQQQYMPPSPSASSQGPSGSVQEHRQSFASTPQQSQPPPQLPPVSSPYLHNRSSPGRTSSGSIPVESSAGTSSILQRPAQSAQEQQQQQQHQHQHSQHQQHPQQHHQHQQHPQHLQQLQQLPPHHQQPQQHQEPLPSASSLHSISGFDRSSIGRGLPPILSPLPPNLPYVSNNDHRQQQPPISPRTIPPNFNLNDALQNVDSISGDHITPRKRSKVSRACDECRRKKIRCDATSESGVERCSSCKRVGSKCSFSRIPMKRGPSKGYIKELADRLNTLENSISTGDIHSYAPNMPGEGELSPQTMEATSPTPGSAGLQKRKRALSSSSDFHGPVHLQPLTQHSPARRSSERLPPIDSFHPSPSQHQQMGGQREHSLSHVQPPPPHAIHPPAQSPPVTATDVSTPFRSQPSPNGIFWKGRVPDFGGDARRSSGNFPFEGPTSEQLAKPSSIGYSHAATSFEWNEDAINDYYDFIHPTLPLLSHSKARLRSRLSLAPPSIREALLEALYSAVRTCPSSRSRGSKSPQRSPRRASDMVYAAQFEDFSVKTFPVTILQLQTLVLMVLEADSHGPGKMLGLTGPPRGAWLGAAIGLAYSLRLHQPPTRAERPLSGHAEDVDADDMLCRRAWWVLVMLDRWHAMSTQSPSMIPDSSISIVPYDEVALGSTPYHLARLSLILGHLSEVFVATSEPVASCAFSPYVWKLIRGELDRFRESVETIWPSESSKTVRAAYYHVKLITLRQNAMSSPDEILDTALRITRLLDTPDSPSMFLQHHFAALSLTALLDLSEFPETREGAWTGVQQIHEWASKRLHSIPSESSTTWERVIKNAIERRQQNKRSSSAATLTYGSLQHFADFAPQPDRSSRTPSPTTSAPPLNEPLHPLDAVRLQKQGYLGSILF